MERTDNFLDKMFNTVFDTKWMNGLYSKKRVEQKSELKKVFVKAEDNDITSGQKAHLKAKSETLQDKVERLEAKMAVLEETLAKNAQMIKQRAKELTDTISRVEDKSKKMEEHQKEVVQDTIEDVFYEYYHTGKPGKDGIANEIRIRLQGNSKLSRKQGEIEGLLIKLNGQNAQVKGLIEEASKWMDQRTILSQQYGATKSAYDLLKGSMGQIGATGTKYSTTDIGTDKPIYSPKKAGLVADLMENYSVPAGENSGFVEGSEPPTLDGIKEKYGEYLGTAKTPDVDTYKYENVAVQNLGHALDEGLFDDLISAGLNYEEISDFLVENFSGTNIKKGEDGQLKIPYGHGKDAHNVYKGVIDGLKEYNLSFQGALNTWDEDHGNTIGTNGQIRKLDESFNDVLDEFANAKPPFTFKEAMYAMFDPEMGIFKDSGVIYDVDKQEKVPNYFIEFAGDKETATMYKEMSEKIFDIWGVKPSRGANYEMGKDDYVPEETKPEEPMPEVERTDPMWFNLENDPNNKFSFVIDRNRDGEFSGAEDFVGGEKGTSWLEDLKSLDVDNDGKLTGDELKNLKVLGTNYHDNQEETMDNTAYNPDAEETKEEFLRGQTTEVDYKLTTAEKMGIEEISLEGLENNVNLATDNIDINNNEHFDDSFSFKMNGEEVTAHRTDETEEFMDSIYGDAKGKRFKIQLTDSEVDETIEEDYGEFDEFNRTYAKTFQDINVLKGGNELAGGARKLFDDTKTRIHDNESAELTKAGNKAAALKTNTGWESIAKEVIDIASREGLIIDQEQAKGIYVLDASLDAEDIVAKYKEQLNERTAIALDEEATKIAWKAMVELARNGLKFNTDSIKELIISGKADSVDEIVEIFKELQDNVDVDLATKELGFDSEREEEIYEAFNEVFNEAGCEDKVVDALAILCQAQQKNPTYMKDKSGEELAQEILDVMTR